MSRRRMFAALALVSAASFAVAPAYAQSASIIPQQAAGEQQSGVAPSPLAAAPSSLKKATAQKSGAISKGLLTPAPEKK